MNCAEFQRTLPELIERENHNLEDDEHFRSCQACSALVADLNAIVHEAPALQALDEPSPRVWNSIEIRLREEGLIRGPLRLSPPRPNWWRQLWLAPVAAALVFGFGIVEYNRGAFQQRAVADRSISGLQVAQNLMPDDQEVLDVVSSRYPAMRAQYAVNLENVDDYIRDAQQTAKSDPNDEQAQQNLMDAYQQKAMVYQMALDRSLQ